MVATAEEIDPVAANGFASKIGASILGTYIDEVLCMVKADNSRYFCSTNGAR